MATAKQQPPRRPGRLSWLMGLTLGILGGAAVALAITWAVGASGQPSGLG